MALLRGPEAAQGQGMEALRMGLDYHRTGDGLPPIEYFDGVGARQVETEDGWDWEQYLESPPCIRIGNRIIAVVVGDVKPGGDDELKQVATIANAYAHGDLVPRGEVGELVEAAKATRSALCRACCILNPHHTSGHEAGVCECADTIGLDAALASVNQNRLTTPDATDSGR